MDKELLTTREVQSLVRLNRVTIYRLIRDGEFPAIKIGGQWRFPRKAIEAWLSGQSSPQPSCHHNETKEIKKPPALSEILAHSELKPVLKAFADATGVSVFVIDDRDDLLTDCIECNPFCCAIHKTPIGLQECLDIWKQPVLSDGEMLTCHAGLHYLAAAINVGGEPIARVLMGPFLADEAHLHAIQQALPALAERLESDPVHLWNSLHNVQQIGPEQAGLLGRLLSRVINAIAQLAYERSTATQRLHQIGLLVDLESPSGDFETGI